MQIFVFSAAFLGGIFLFAAALALMFSSGHTELLPILCFAALLINIYTYPLRIKKQREQFT